MTATLCVCKHESPVTDTDYTKIVRPILLQAFEGLESKRDGHDGSKVKVCARIESTQFQCIVLLVSGGAHWSINQFLLIHLVRMTRTQLFTFVSSGA